MSVTMCWYWIGALRTIWWEQIAPSINVYEINFAPLFLASVEVFALLRPSTTATVAFTIKICTVFNDNYYQYRHNRHPHRNSPEQLCAQSFPSGHLATPSSVCSPHHKAHPLWLTWDSARRFGPAGRMRLSDRPCANSHKSLPVPTYHNITSCQQLTETR